MKKLLFLFLFTSSVIGQSVSMVWDANTEVDLAGYHVYRKDPGMTTFARLTASILPCGPSDFTCTTYADGAVAYGVTYEWVVTAVNTSGLESGFSNVLSANVLNPNAPSAPTGLVLVVIAKNEFQLDWADVEGADYYEVWVARKQADNWHIEMTTLASAIPPLKMTGQRRWAMVRAIDGGVPGAFTAAIRIGK